MTKPTRPPWFSPWDLLPLAGALALAAALPSLLRSLPDPIPTHFDARGVANGWTPHAAYPWLALGLPGGAWLLLLLTGRAFAGSDQDPDGLKCHALAPLRGLLTTGLLWMTTGGLFIHRHGQGVILWMVGGFLVLTFLGVGLMVRRMKQTLRETQWPGFARPLRGGGRGGTQRAQSARAVPPRSCQDPRSKHYRWGLCYVNPEDPAIWVPKRLGLGWTLNFAHGLSWFVLLLLLLPVFLVIALLRPR